MDAQGHWRAGQEEPGQSRGGKSRPDSGACSSGREVRETPDPNVTMGVFCEVTVMTVIMDGASLVPLLTSSKK